MEHSKLLEPMKIGTWGEQMAVMGEAVRALGRRTGPLNVLEAGCGVSWGLDLGDVKYTLTGVDLDQSALDARLKLQKDLDIGICADLRTVHLERSHYHVIYSRYVLEHVAGVENVLTNFVDWLKPGGLLILVIPDRDSVWGFLTRLTPFRFHVLFKKYLIREPHAGEPGYPPYPTIYDKIVSRRGIHGFCADHALKLCAEYRIVDGQGDRPWIAHLLISAVSGVMHVASLKRLARNCDLIYILQKPAETQHRAHA
jgi:SAM-dependent methyltransferase